MIDRRAALGIRAHSGWAAVVAVAGSFDEPLVLANRRLPIAASTDVMHTQPYHVAAELGALRGRIVVERCAADAEAVAKAAFARFAGEFPQHAFGACAILTPRNREPVEFEMVLRSHALMHAAEGILFRTAVARAAAACNLEIHAYEEDELLSGAAAAWRTAPQRVERAVNGLGRSAGRPWARDQKLATLAALLALHVQRKTVRRRAG